MSKSHHIAKKGRNRVQQSPKRVFLFPEKMFMRFRDCLRRLLHMRMSLFWGFLFPEKSFCRFRDCRMNRRKNADVPFLTILISGKSWLWFGNVFAICLHVSDLFIHLQTQNQNYFVRHHLNQIRPMICDTFYLILFATGQCCVPWQMQPPCKETISLSFFHSFLQMN